MGDPQGSVGRSPGASLSPELFAVKRARQRRDAAVGGQSHLQEILSGAVLLSFGDGKRVTVVLWFLFP